MVGAERDQTLRMLVARSRGSAQQARGTLGRPRERKLDDELQPAQERGVEVLLQVRRQDDESAGIERCRHKKG